MIILASKLSFKKKRETLSRPVVLGALKDIENQPDTNNVRALAGQHERQEVTTKQSCILFLFAYNLHIKDCIFRTQKDD